MIVIEGNDGVGKTVIADLLRQRGFDVQDRGILTRMTDDPTLNLIDGEIYLILDVPVRVSRVRLARAGKDLNEQYHTIKDLTFYRQRYLELAKHLLNCILVDASGTPTEVADACMIALKKEK